jgi:hypothetical protein
MVKIRDCCGEACGSGRYFRGPIHDVNTFTNSYVFTHLLTHYSRSFERRGNDVLSALNHSNYSRGMYNWQGTDVCQLCFSRLYNISTRTIRRKIASIKQGINSIEHGRKGGKALKGEKRDKRDAVRDAIKYIVNRDAQCMPHRAVGELALHYCSMQDVVDTVRRYVFENNLGMTVSRSLVRAVLREDFKHVTCPKSKVFLKCGVCDELKLKIKQAPEHEKHIYRTQLERHRIEMNEQREKYYSACSRVICLSFSSHFISP